MFYDGPPFANGLPHYGHLLTGFVKDAVPRYQTMRGRRVERRFGWDCHGLPAEVEAERELGLSGPPDILGYGIDRFNDACRTSVLRFTSEWERYVTRQARWVDFTNDYKTLDLPYMESVMWAFKTLWDKGLIYEGFRVLAYCWRCETPLSNTETRMDDVYRDRQDPALTVWFELEPGPAAKSGEPGLAAKSGEPGLAAKSGEPGLAARSGEPGLAARSGEPGLAAKSGEPGLAAKSGEPGLAARSGETALRILAWTTTPWTLPANLALAVGPDIDYAVMEEADGHRYVLAEARLDAYQRELAGATASAR